MKRRLLSSIFPEKITFSENTFRTPRLDEALAILASKHGLPQTIGQKKTADVGGLSLRASPDRQISNILLIKLLELGSIYEATGQSVA